MMDFDRRWTTFAINAEINDFGSERLVDAHNQKIKQLETEVASWKTGYTLATNNHIDREEALLRHIAILQKQAKRLRELLRRYEWKGPYKTCPDCGWSITEGHPPACDLQRAIEGDE